MTANDNTTPATAVVIGASGQDGFYLTERLLAEGWTVHATTRNPTALDAIARATGVEGRLHVHLFELTRPASLFEVIARVRPAEVYNLAGESSVARSFVDPLGTWRTNADFVTELLECVRRASPATRFYQASSTDMFGVSPHGVMLYGEHSPLHPQSPYASAKAAAHLLCHAYREVFGLRIASGILSNHESHRRSSSFLSRKVVDHVLKLKQRREIEPLAVGNLKIERDWGFAPDYVEGMCRILRQIEFRSRLSNRPLEPDESYNYRDYVLATGKTHAVWQLVDCAFALGGFELDWRLDGEDASEWRATFRDDGRPAVVVNPVLLRRAEPRVIKADPTRARRELGWSPRQGLEVFLRDMILESSRF